MKVKTTILFVDDEPYVLDALSRLFRGEEYELCLAGSAKAALDSLARMPVHVVVSDFRMPGMNGGELLKIVAEEWPDTVRLILSGHTDIGSVVSAINEGQIYKFIVKPWDNIELKSAVSQAAEKYWQQASMRALAEAAVAENQALVADFLNDFDRVKQHGVYSDLSLENGALLDLIFEALLGPVVVFRNEEPVYANKEGLEFLGLSALTSISKQAENSQIGQVKSFVAALLNRNEKTSGTVIHSTEIAFARTMFRSIWQTDGTLLTLMLVQEKPVEAAR